MRSIAEIIQAAGLAQLLLVAGGLFIPKIMNWKDGLKNCPDIIRQMFWNYAGYIAGTNVFFGIISLFIPEELIRKSPLAAFMLAFIALYWIIRVLVQLFYFDTSSFPKNNLHKAAEAVLMMLFVALSVWYSYLFYLQWP